MLASFYCDLALRVFLHLVNGNPIEKDEYFIAMQGHQLMFPYNKNKTCKHLPTFAGKSFHPA